MTSIGSGAFSDNDDLVDVSLPNELSELADYLFAYSPSVQIVQWPEQLKLIGEDAFSSHNLETLDLPDTVERIDDWAFESWVNQIPYGHLDLPESLTSIGYAAYRNLVGIETVDIPAGVTEIGDRAFEGTSITRVDLPSVFAEELPYSSFPVGTEFFIDGVLVNEFVYELNEETRHLIIEELSIAALPAQCSPRR